MDFWNLRIKSWLKSLEIRNEKIMQIKCSFHFSLEVMQLTHMPIKFISYFFLCDRAAQLFEGYIHILGSFLLRRGFFPPHIMMFHLQIKTQEIRIHLINCYRCLNIHEYFLDFKVMKLAYHIPINCTVIYAQQLIRFFIRYRLS